ncbi:MAG: methyltransferase regulatory domain-containing protein [Formosimonas sp.]
MNQNSNTQADFASYDEMPYTSYAFTDSHPSRLRAIARIFGLDAPQLSHARVLELGCASGGNLTPLALYFPNMQLVGVDYSSVQIKDGHRIIEQLGLTNVELKHMSIADITPELGQFDYIICHGVYSWVPPEVQSAIMRVCQENLRDNGVAYISYNVYPGWKTHEITRDAMLFHTRHLGQGLERVAHARGMIEYMHQMSDKNSIFARVMEGETARIQSAEPYYIAHEFLETHNAPCYLHQFVQRAQEHGLDYLGDTHLSSMFVETLNPEDKQRLLNVCEGNQVILEQYFDFLRNRTFRQTVLVKKAQAPSINRTLQNQNLQRLRFLMSARQIPQDDANVHRYENHRQQNVTVSLPTQKAILQVLSQSPSNPMTFDAIKNRVQALVGVQYNDTELNALLEQLVVIGFVQIWSDVSAEDFINGGEAVPAYPRVVTGLAKFAQGIGHLTSHIHHNIKSNWILNVLLPQMDGSHNVEQLAQVLIAAVHDGQIQFQRHGTLEVVTDKAEIEREARLHVQSNLELLHSNGFLQRH